MPNTPVSGQELVPMPAADQELSNRVEPERYTRFKNTMQDLLAFPGATDEIIDRFAETTRSDLAQKGWLESRAHVAEHTVKRYCRDVLLGALAHVGLSHSIAQALPYFEDESLPLSRGAADSVEKLLDFKDPDLGWARQMAAALSPTRQKFITTTLSWVLGPTYTLFGDIQTDPNHLYHPLMDRLLTARTEVRAAQIARETTEETKGKPLGPLDFNEDYTSIMLDNFNSTAIILAKRQAIRQELGRDTSPATMRRIAQHDVVHLGRITSVNAKIFQVIMSTPDFLIERGPADNPTCAYTHPSLQSNAGIWRHPALCGGQYDIRPGEEHLRWAVDRFLTLNHRLPDDGAIDAFTAVFLLGAKAAQETIWREPLA